MPPALRKRPFRLACAAAISAPVPQGPGREHLMPASASRQSRPVIGSGR